MKESNFQKNLIEKIKNKFPGCMILKNDPNYIQGIPDLTIFYQNKWATLEVKKSEKAYKNNDNKNQFYYVEKMNNMSFSRFIYPENEEEVLNDLEQSFS